MGRKTTVLGMLFGAGLAFISGGLGANLVSIAAAAECPAGQVFNAQENRCVAAGPVRGPAPAPTPAAKCPPGQTFNAQENRCVAVPPAPGPPGGLRPGG